MDKENDNIRDDGEFDDSYDIDDNDESNKDEGK